MPAGAPPHPDGDEPPLYRHPVPDPAWLERRREPILDPGRRVVDPHHHLWRRNDQTYLLPEFLQDLGSGHDVAATVFVQCHWSHRPDGPEALRPVGETEAVQRIAEEADARGARTRVCAGIVGFADLALGDDVKPVLEAHLAAAGGRFRGVRHTTAREETFRASIAPPPPAGLMGSDGFRRGVARLGPLGLSLDAWLFHTQLDELSALARAFPEQPIVLNHIGGRLALGRYAADPAAVFADWRAGLARLAVHPNVVLKVGGLGMVLAGHAFHERALPPSSEELAAAWAPTLDVCLELFGPARCMVESNFPVDKAMFAYPVLWNAFKRLAAPLSEPERDALLRGTAARFYRIEG